MIITVGEHSIEESLLTGGYVLDAGCRGFEFAVAMRDLGEKVMAYDIEVFTPPPGIRFFQAAIIDAETAVHYKKTGDPQGTHVTSEPTEYLVNGINLDLIYRAVGYNSIDVLKLDVEGSEYRILAADDFEPVPRQISVEFHMHCHPELHDRYYLRAMANLVQHYDIVRHEFTAQHGAGYNYWDSLFIKKT